MIYHAIMLPRSWSAVLSSRPIFIANVEVDSAVGPKAGCKRPIKNSRCWNSHKALRKPTLWVLVVCEDKLVEAPHRKEKESICLHYVFNFEWLYLLLKERYTFKKRDSRWLWLTLPDQREAPALVARWWRPSQRPVSIIRSCFLMDWCRDRDGGGSLREWLRPEHSLRGDQKGWEAVHTGRRLMHFKQREQRLCLR